MKFLRSSMLSFSPPPGSSAPVDPDSPISVGLSSTATSVSEVDELLGDIISLESVDATMDKDLALFDHHVHTSQTVSIHGYRICRSTLRCPLESKISQSEAPSPEAGAPTNFFGFFLKTVCNPICYPIIDIVKALWPLDKNIIMPSFQMSSCIPPSPLGK